MSKAKTNPRKVPRTEADCKREYKKGYEKGYEKGVDDGMKHLLEMVLFVLIDKHDAPREDIHTLNGEITYLEDSIKRGDITWEDISHVLYDEFDLEVHLA